MEWVQNLLSVCADLRAKDYMRGGLVLLVILAVVMVPAVSRAVIAIYVISILAMLCFLGKLWWEAPHERL